jgi:hypothetical protein
MSCIRRFVEIGCKGTKKAGSHQTSSSFFVLARKDLQEERKGPSRAPSTFASRKNSVNIWQFGEKAVPLQPHLTKPPSLMKAERTFEGCLVLTINSSKQCI